ncbi:MAG: transcriptional regulator, partial [Rhodanobacter sp.]
MSAQIHPVYRFADCELDPHERRLLVRGKAVTLTPKVFDTLLLLIEHAGHLVGKDELMAALWPRGFVHESNLTKHIWLIRRALGDDGHEGHCIENVPKLGYRFIAPVQRLEGGVGGVPVPSATSPVEPVIDVQPVAVARTPSAHWPLVTVVAALALIVVAMLWWWHGKPVGTADASGNAVAIVDFNNLSNNAKDAWLAPALSEMLAIELTAGGRLHAIPDELVRAAHA